MTKPIAAVKINGLYFRWPASGFALAIPALEVAERERLFIQGASGAGKSTLLNLLAGILLPQRGSIEIGGTDFTQLSARRRDTYRAQHIGIIFQQFNLIPYLDVETNIRLAAYFGGEKANATAGRVHGILDALRLPRALLPRQAGSLSVGQQQRVAIARAVINRPRLIIADEPTSALDNDARDSFIELLLRIREEQASAVIFVSHDRALSSSFSRVLDITGLNAAEGAA